MEAPVGIFGKASDGQWYPIAAVAPVAATQTLTLVANPANGDTVTVGGKTYNFRTSLTNVANYVKIGATASDSLDNLIAAINRDPGDGTLYAAATLQNTQVSAAAGAGDTMVVTARIPGYSGNSIAATETFTNGGNVWGAATLAGGTNAGLDVGQADILAAINKTIPATTAAAVTPSDATALTSRAVWVGGAGDLVVRLSGAPSTTVTLTGVAAGTLLPISVVRVMAATTATNINVLN